MSSLSLFRLVSFESEVGVWSTGDWRICEVVGVGWVSGGMPVDLGCRPDPSPWVGVTPTVVENNGVTDPENPLPTLRILENTFFVWESGRYIPSEGGKSVNSLLRKSWTNRGYIKNFEALVSRLDNIPLKIILEKLNRWDVLKQTIALAIELLNSFQAVFSERDNVG